VFVFYGGATAAGSPLNDEKFGILSGNHIYIVRAERIEKMNSGNSIMKTMNKWIFTSGIALAVCTAWAVETTPAVTGLDWGKEVNGIRCAVRPAKESFSTGEFIAVEILYRNTSDQAKTVYIRPDPFWRWMKYQITDTSDRSGVPVSGSPIVDGAERPLNKTDFVTIQPGKTASCKATTESIWLKPGQYRIIVDINRVNRIIHGFEQFCQDNDLSVWVAPIQSGVGVLTVTAMPPVQWGRPHSNSLACGIGTVEIKEDTITVPVFMKNVGIRGARKYFDGSVFELQLAGQRYLPANWPAANARQLHIPSGREIGPIPLSLADYISESDRGRHKTASRPLTRLAPGSHRLRVVYVAMNGSPRIPSPEVVVTVPAANKQ
jgi:hypothetical protein